MSRNWLIGVGIGLLATAALVTVGVTAYELGERETETVIVSGTETVGGRVIVDNDGWRHGPGPGFLIVPLLIVGGIFLLSSRRRHGWCGPGHRHDRHWDDRQWDERYRSERYDWERDRGSERPVDAPPSPPSSTPAPPAPTDPSP